MNALAEDGWVPFIPRAWAGGKSGPDCGVAMSLSALGRGAGRRIFVRLDTAALPALSWLEEEGRVGIWFGRGLNIGKLRVGPGGVVRLASRGGKARNGKALARRALSMVLEPPEWLPEGVFRTQFCPFELLDDMLVIEMPAWGIPNGPPVPVALPATVTDPAPVSERRPGVVPDRAVRPEGMADIEALLRDADMCSTLGRLQKEALRALKVRARREGAALVLCEADIALLLEARAKVYGL